MSEDVPLPKISQLYRDDHGALVIVAIKDVVLPQPEQNPPDGIIRDDTLTLFGMFPSDYRSLPRTLSLPAYQKEKWALRLYTLSNRLFLYITFPHL